jgi:hypothetical protein
MNYSKSCLHRVEQHCAATVACLLFSVVLELVYRLLGRVAGQPYVSLAILQIKQLHLCT